MAVYDDRAVGGVKIISAKRHIYVNIIDYII